jgi:phenylalanyl-tRNA synthetase beta chain
MAERGLRRAIEMMRQVAGGEIAEGIIDEYPKPAPVVQVELPAAEVERILGIPVPVEEAARILEALEFAVEIRDQRLETGSSPISNRQSPLRVTVPDHRLDIGTGVVGQADLIEEVARIYGYDRLPETQMSDTIPPQRTNAALEREERVRDILVACGLQEVINYRLTTPERESRLLPGGVPRDARPYMTLANPIASDRVVMRHTLLAGLLEIAAANLRFHDRLALFELGQVYVPVGGGDPQALSKSLEGPGGPGPCGSSMGETLGSPESQRPGPRAGGESPELPLLPGEPARLGIVLTGPREPESWRGGDRQPMGFYDLKGVIEALVSDLHLPPVSYAPAAHPTYHPGRCAELRIDSASAESLISDLRSLGTIGELHPLVREAFDLPPQPVLVADLDLEALLAAVPDRYRTTSVPVYPPVLEDLAVIVDETVSGASVEAAIRAAGSDLLAGLRLFDVYRGEQIGAGKKSLAYSLTYQAPGRTLTDIEVAKVREAIVRRLEQEVGARLRG